MAKDDDENKHTVNPKSNLTELEKT